jgi:hypothetical protein
LRAFLQYDFHLLDYHRDRFWGLYFIPIALKTLYAVKSSLRWSVIYRSEQSGALFLAIPARFCGANVDVGKGFINPDAAEARYALGVQFSGSRWGEIWRG